jgi:hypothetical protein
MSRFGPNFAARTPQGKGCKSHFEPGMKRGYITFFTTKHLCNALYKVIGMDHSKRTDLDNVEKKPYSITIGGTLEYINQTFNQLQELFPMIERWKLRIID